MWFMLILIMVFFWLAPEETAFTLGTLIGVPALVLWVYACAL